MPLTTNLSGYVDILPDINLPVDYLLAANERDQKSLDGTRAGALKAQETALLEAGPNSLDLTKKYNQDYSEAFGKILADVNSGKFSAGQGKQAIMGLQNQMMQADEYERRSLLAKEGSEATWNKYAKEVEDYNKYGDRGFYNSIDPSTGLPIQAADIQNLREIFPGTGTTVNPTDIQTSLQHRTRSSIVDQEELVRYTEKVPDGKGGFTTQWTTQADKFFTEELVSQRLDENNKALLKIMYDSEVNTNPLLYKELREIEKLHDKDVALEVYKEMLIDATRGQFFDRTKLNSRKIPNNNGGGGSDEEEKDKISIGAVITDFSENKNSKVETISEALKFTEPKNIIKAVGEVMTQTWGEMQDTLENYPDVERIKTKKVDGLTVFEPTGNKQLDFKLKEYEYKIQQQELSLLAEFDVIQKLKEQNNITGEEPESKKLQAFVEKELKDAKMQSAINDNMPLNSSVPENTQRYAYLLKKALTQKIENSTELKEYKSKLLAGLKFLPVSTWSGINKLAKVGFMATGDEKILNLNPEELEKVDAEFKEYLINQGLDNNIVEPEVAANIRAFKEDLKQYNENKNSLDLPTFYPTDSNLAKQLQKGVEAIFKTNILGQKPTGVRILGVDNDSKEELELLKQFAESHPWLDDKQKYQNVDFDNIRLMESPFGGGVEAIMSLTDEDGKIHNIAFDSNSLQNLDSAALKEDLISHRDYIEHQEYYKELATTKGASATLRGPFRDTNVQYVQGDIETSTGVIPAGTPLFSVNDQIYTASSQQEMFELNRVLNSPELQTSKALDAFMISDTFKERFPSIHFIDNNVIQRVYGRDLKLKNKTRNLETSGKGYFGSENVKTLMNKLVQVESSGNPNAKAKTSSATGATQFIKSTWLNMLDKYGEGKYDNLSEEEKLELRKDKDLSVRMGNFYAIENEQYLSSNGVETTVPNLYLAHFLGPYGAVRVLSLRDKNTKIKRYINKESWDSNPSVFKNDNMTLRDLENWAAKKYS